MRLVDELVDALCVVMSAIAVLSLPALVVLGVLAQLGIVK